ncbi:shikimate dehydrogenase family protein [Eudoraea chungangensis]|uniref:shikimate dehydrogenase family protein n=1 Tax=Eudoraea chungangensis TaxID=1481905 RepID=UPI0023ED3677|nr:shikimate dehydrogenase [Eudoraea chungangensis]
MEKKEQQQSKFGLIGRNINYSFSKTYFTKKFGNLSLQDYYYDNFHLDAISELPNLLRDNRGLKGLNVTIPYKEEVIKYLDRLDEEASKIGAVNTIRFTPSGLKGYNTDAFGFRESLLPHLKSEHQKALILGTGGASKAIAYVLGKLNITYTFVSRNPTKDQLAYTDLTKEVIEANKLCINCTPLGTHPNILDKPSLPYEYYGKEHLLYDLIYNPSKTAFLLEGEKRGATIINGLSMLELQAEKSWEIWNL